MVVAKVLYKIAYIYLMQEKLKEEVTTLRSCINVFTKSDQQKILAVIFLQILLGLLDLLGVLLIGFVGALSVTGVKSGAPTNRVNDALEFFQLENLTLQEQTAFLGLLAAAILVGRTVLSVFFTRKILYFISRRSAIISGDLIKRLLQLDNLEISRRTVQETIYASTTGVVAVTLGVVGTAVSMVADASLLIVMALGLILIDPLIAVCTFMLFSIIGLILYKAMHGRAISLGMLDAELNVLSNEKISEVLLSYREAIVRSRRSFYASEISQNRFRLSNVLAELSFMPSISKYVIEGTMVVGALSVAAIQFALQSAEEAVSTLAIFIVAGMRIAPAILRFQQGVISIKSNMGAANPTLSLLSELPPYQEDASFSENFDHFKDFEGQISISGLSFTYPGSANPALVDINLEIAPGTTCAIVGPSGSGKTTLVDLILGMFEPTSGSVTISGQQPTKLIKVHPGSIGYVPQDVSIIQGTIRQNIALGFPTVEADDARVMSALKVGQLDEFVNGLPEGLDSNVGTRGTKLSGGQRQRLGIARAMFTKPKLLVLDESTSALDAISEVKVSDALSDIPYNITKLIIAHRLSTVRHADKVVYLDNGKILAAGSFDFVRNVVPDFDVQAKLMGL
jgi:ABC-type multidrug transport system fused ATPase/permease subunit